MNLVSIEKLKPHSRNNEYFQDITGEKYEEIKRSIEASGIRDPLKVLPDYTILAGHQRYRIARELGIEQVPVLICDVDENEAEYLLIADNEERRMDDPDPMRKAKRAKFLKEYWNVKKGGDRKSKGQNVPLKTYTEVAEAIGESEKTTKRLIKLNDLIPELQQLISDKKLGTTAGEALAHLTSDEQKALYNTLGETIGDQSVQETRELRQTVEAERKQREAFQQSIQNNERTIAELRHQLAEAQQVESQVIEVVPDEIKQAIQRLEEENKQTQKQLTEREKEIRRIQDVKKRALRDKEKAETEKWRAQREQEQIEKTLHAMGSDVDQAATLNSVAAKLFDYKREIVGLVETLNPQYLNEHAFRTIASLQVDLHRMLDRLDKLANSLQGKNNNIVSFRKENGK